MIFFHSEQVMIGRLHQTCGDIIILYNNIYSHASINTLKKRNKNRKLRLFMFRDLKIARPSMFAVRAKIYGMVYNQFSSIAFHETSCYCPAPKSF